MTNKLIILVGLPGSGKSTYAKSIQGNVHIHSSDVLREELCGDTTDQSKNELVFKTLHQRIKNDLDNGFDCVYDACNISRKTRMNILRQFNCDKICVFMATPYEQCLINNQHRNRTIPDGVIKRMYLAFDPPALYEGFNDIQIQYANGAKNSLSLDKFLSNRTNQENRNHSLPLEEHCMKARDYIYTQYPISKENLTIAAALHDEGKLFTKDFHNSKGEITKDAHYFSHHNVGSYNSFFYDLGAMADHLYIAQLINWHMRPYMAWEVSNKSMIKDKALLPADLFNDICILHEADVRAH